MLDGYAIFLFVCLVDGRKEGRKEGKGKGKGKGREGKGREGKGREGKDGCCVNRGGRGCGEGAALRDGWFWLLGLLVAWWVCWLGRVVAWLVGWLVALR